ncbi:MAG: MarR family transcriptional regulator [Stappiaceae bacterium]
MSRQLNVTTSTAMTLSTGFEEMTNHESSPVDDQIGFKLRIANQRYLEIIASVVPELTPAQFTVLAKLAEEGSVSQNQLGRLVAMDAATIKGVVDRLREKGCVNSAPSETDMRRRIISLSEQGKVHLHNAAERVQEVSDKTLTKLNQAEREHLLVLLDRI